MVVLVRLFARAKDLVGAERVRVELSEAATVGELRKRLGFLYPQLAGLLERSAVAVGGEFAEESYPLNPHTEVALLPPVSGG